MGTELWLVSHSLAVFDAATCIRTCLVIALKHLHRGGRGVEKISIGRFLPRRNKLVRFCCEYTGPMPSYELMKRKGLRDHPRIALNLSLECENEWDLDLVWQTLLGWEHENTNAMSLSEVLIYPTIEIQIFSSPSNVINSLRAYSIPSPEIGKGLNSLTPQHSPSQDMPSSDLIALCRNGK